MKTTNYFDTFISVSEDCTAQKGEVPPLKEDKKSIARIQFELINGSPYRFTSDDILFNVYAKRNDIAEDKMSREREEFFSKDQACLRSSPLVKRYGWGIHYNEKGLISIYPMESKEYKIFSRDKELKQLKGMRSKRK